MTPTNDIVEIAKRIAIKAHDGQFRRDGVTPYIKHPEAVASRLKDNPGVEAVAWLHDVLEDTSVTVEDLRDQGISNQMIDIVIMLTKKKDIPYDEYIKTIASNRFATEVKIADMLANLSDSPTEDQVLKYMKSLLYLLDSDK